ncbi:LysE family translocator [Plantactinospora sp. WMMB334]|uniref:LysE family translocator n=1 Tax=Plantactinospora sp. WMMB334 TaxID=3404119 RepID=UPI003B948E10
MSEFGYVPAGTLVGYLAVITLFMLTPGPDMLYVLANAVRYGARASVAAAAGVAVGEIIHVAVAIAGLSVVIANSPTLYATIRYAGAAYLITLGLLALRRPANPPTARQDAAPATIGLVKAAGRGLLTNLLNPKMILFTIAFLPQFVDLNRGHVTAQFLVLGAVFVAVQLAVDIALGLVTGRLAGRLTTGRPARLLHRISAVAFFGIGVHLAIG